jgi:hypothetical protein
VGFVWCLQETEVSLYSFHWQALLKEAQCSVWGKDYLYVLYILQILLFVAAAGRTNGWTVGICWQRDAVSEMRQLQKTRRICCAVAKLRKGTIIFVMSVCLCTCLPIRPHVCPQSTTGLALDEFSWNLVVEYFVKNICGGSSSFIKIWQE